MFKVAIGHSEHFETKQAIKEIVKQCRETLEGIQPSAGLVFASVSYDLPVLLAEIKKEFPEIQLAGCSSFGEISSKIGIGQDSVGLMLFASDEVKFLAVLAEDVSQNEQTKLFQAAEVALKNIQSTPSLCCVFADGLTSNVSHVINGLKTYFENEVPTIAGGTACDDWQFKKVFQFYNGQVSSNSTSLLLFTHPLKVSIAVRHGRTPLPFTTKHIVTRSENNVVYTIDNKSTLDFYKEQLGEYTNYEAYALIVYLEDPEKNPDKYLIRAPFKINYEDGSIVFPADVPLHSVVGISQISTQKKTLEAAEECVTSALTTFPGKKMDAALIFSCALRKEILGTDTYKELELIKKKLPKDLPFFGFYTYGEIGSYNTGDPTSYYNETIVIVLLGE